jgi:hypothetical protein
MPRTTLWAHCCTCIPPSGSVQGSRSRRPRPPAATSGRGLRLPPRPPRPAQRAPRQTGARAHARQRDGLSETRHECSASLRFKQSKRDLRFGCDEAHCCSIQHRRGLCGTNSAMLETIIAVIRTSVRPEHPRQKRINDSVAHLSVGFAQLAVSGISASANAQAHWLAHVPVHSQLSRGARTATMPKR